MYVYVSEHANSGKAIAHARKIWSVVRMASWVYVKNAFAVLCDVFRGRSACKRLLRRDEDTTVGISVRATPCKQPFRSQ